MDKQLAQHITNETTNLVMEENRRLQQENEDLKRTNEILLEDTKMCGILSARVNTLEKEYNKYYNMCVDLQKANDMLLYNVGSSNSADR